MVRSTVRRSRTGSPDPPARQWASPATASCAPASAARSRGATSSCASAPAGTARRPEAICGATRCAASMAENPNTLSAEPSQRTPSPRRCARRARHAQPGDRFGRRVAANRTRRQVRSACAVRSRGTRRVDSARAVDARELARAGSQPRVEPSRARRKRPVGLGSSSIHPEIAPSVSTRRQAPSGCVAAGTTAALLRRGRRWHRAPQARSSPAPGGSHLTSTSGRRWC